MIKKIVFTLLTIQAFLFADFKSISVKDMIDLQKNGAPIIDIRTPEEWKETGVIPGSKKIMFFDENGNYDVQKFMRELQKVVKDKNQPFILVCRTASRTKVVGEFLSKEVGYAQVKDLDGGIMYGWGKRETVQ
jgi:rhodanese-related sulfurtransferase